MQMQSVLEPLPLNPSETPPETVESTPLKAMQMQSALKTLPLA